MTKHTPGPWTCGLMDEKHRGSNMAWVSGPCGCIAHVYPDREPDNALASARLITAAPDLLAACKEVLRLLVLEADEVTELEETGVRTLLDAAIAKAEGREP